MIVLRALVETPPELEATLLVEWPADRTMR
jgi:hypothetical protein